MGKRKASCETAHILDGSTPPILGGIGRFSISSGTVICARLTNGKENLPENTSMFPSAAHFAFPTTFQSTAIPKIFLDEVIKLCTVQVMDGVFVISGDGENNSRVVGLPTWNNPERECLVIISQYLTILAKFCS